MGMDTLKKLLEEVNGEIEKQRTVCEGIDDSPGAKKESETCSEHRIADSAEKILKLLGDRVSSVRVSDGEIEIYTDQYYKDL